MRTPIALLASLLLAAPALAQIKPNPFNDQFKRLAPADRDGALRRAVTLENQRCGRVTGRLYRGMYDNLGYWQVRCKPGGDYAVFLGPGGEAQVRLCGDLKALKLPECRAFPAG